MMCLSKSNGYTTNFGLADMFGNVAQIVVRNGGNFASVGGNFRTVVADPKALLTMSKDIASAEVSIFVGFRPALIPAEGFR